jgi:hypothetical protein
MSSQINTNTDINMDKITTAIQEAMMVEFDTNNPLLQAIIGDPEIFKFGGYKLEDIRREVAGAFMDKNGIDRKTGMNALQLDQFGAALCVLSLVFVHWGLVTDIKAVVMKPKLRDAWKAALQEFGGSGKISMNPRTSFGPLSPTQLTQARLAGAFPECAMRGLNQLGGKMPMPDRMNCPFGTDLLPVCMHLLNFPTLIPVNHKYRQVLISAAKAVNMAVEVRIKSTPRRGEKVAPTKDFLKVENIYMAITSGNVNIETRDFDILMEKCGVTKQGVLDANISQVATELENFIRGPDFAANKTPMRPATLPGRIVSKPTTTAGESASGETKIMTDTASSKSQKTETAEEYNLKAIKWLKPLLDDEKHYGNLSNSNFAQFAFAMSFHKDLQTYRGPTIVNDPKKAELLAKYDSWAVSKGLPVHANIDSVKLKKGIQEIITIAKASKAAEEKVSATD